MIKTDDELENIIYGIERKNKELEHKTKFNYLIKYSSPFLFLIMYLLIVKGISLYKENLLLSLSILFFMVYLAYIWGILDSYMENEIKKDESEMESLQKEKDDTLDFIAYLTAARQLSALEQENINIYPELRINDSKYVYNKFYDKYEKKRLEYEEEHKKRLELNKNK